MRPLPPLSTVLVTGSTSGIGLGIAAELARWSPGAHVFLTARNSSPSAMRAVLDAQAEGHQQARDRGEVEFIQSDLRTAEGCEELLNHVISRTGRIDVLVNNAGIQHVTPIDEFPVDKYEEIINLNLSSCFHTTRVALPTMKEQNFGRIINVSSAHGLVASPNKSAYVAAKHAMNGLTKAVALEVARMNITCNAICPGWVLTPLVEKQIRARMEKKGTTYEAETAELVGEKMPSARPASAAEMGNVCVFLASPDNRSTNGATIAIDGAMKAGTIGRSEQVAHMPHTTSS